MSSKDMITLLMQFRDLCLRLHPEDFQIASRAELDNRFGTSTKRDHLLSFLAGLREEPIDDVCRLAKTPRLLKLILRRSFQIWDHLHGELDFDELVAANTLRFAAPEAFEFLLDNHERIRGLLRDKDRNDRLIAVDEKWIQTTKRVEWDTVSAKNLAQFLFPCWKEGNSEPPLQGMQVSEPTDYWKRFLAEELPIDTVRDQEVVRSLINWKTDHGSPVFRGATLSSALCKDEVFSGVFEHFAPLVMSGQDISEVASSLFSEALLVHGVKAHADSVPGFIPLWRRAIRQPIDESHHTKWVVEEISRALPISLRFANDLYYYWSTRRESEIGRPKDRRRLRHGIVQRARREFEGRVKEFLRVLDPGYMYSSYHFCVLYSLPEEGGPGFVATDWLWFADLLVSAGEISPQTIVPQIVCFLIDEESGIPEFNYTFNEDRTSELFGDNQLRLMKVLSTNINVEPFDMRERKRILLAREIATQWLKDNDSETP